MSDNTIQFDEDLIKYDLKALVPSGMKETFIALPDKEADERISAQKFEQSPEMGVK